MAKDNLHLYEVVHCDPEVTGFNPAPKLAPVSRITVFLLVTRSDLISKNIKNISNIESVRW